MICGLGRSGSGSGSSLWLRQEDAAAAMKSAKAAAHALMALLMLNNDMVLLNIPVCKLACLFHDVARCSPGILLIGY